jgi:cytoskeletal protein RodZ
MQFFSGNATHGRHLGILYIFRNKSFLFIVALLLVSVSSLVVHAATLHSSVYAPFGILGAPTGDANSQVDGASAIMPQNNTTATSSVSIDVEHSVDPINPQQQPTTSVTIDNTKIAVPDNGDVSKTVTSDDGQTTVNVQVSNQSTNTSRRNSLRINSSSHTSQSSTTTTIQKVTSQGDLQP